LFNSGRISEARRRQLAATIFSLAVPLVVFYVARITLGISLWVDRYIFWSAIPVVLLVGVVLAEQQGAKRLLWAVVVLLVMASIPQEYPTSSWRKVAQILAYDRARNPQVAIAAQTGFIEANNITFLRDPRWRSYFLSPLLYYGDSGDIRLLPFDSRSEESLSYISQVSEELVNSATDEVILIAGPIGFDEVGRSFMQGMFARGFGLVSQTSERERYLYRFRRMSDQLGRRHATP